MKCHALFLGALAVVMLNLPTFAADGASGIVGVRWGKNAFNFEGMSSGPQPLRNLSRSWSAIIAIPFSRPKPPPS
jgi:hypothetical protein